MGFIQNQSGRLLIACSLLAVITTGCGRTRSSLTSRVDVSEVMGDSPTEERSMNERIASERSDKKPTVAEAAEHLLASAEEPKKSWKDRLVGKRSKPASDFGTDPFLDDLDEMIASETAQVQRVVKNRAEDAATSNAAELFGDFEQQAEQTLAALDEAANKPIDNAVQIFDATAEDVFGATESAASDAQRKIANAIDRGRVAAVERVESGEVVHRFEDLFGSDAGSVQQTAAQTPDEAAGFEVSHAEVPAMPAMPAVASTPTDPEPADDLAGLFGDESPSTTPADAIDPGLPESPPTAMDEPLFDEPTETIVDVLQQDAVVSPNQPAAIPSLPVPKRAEPESFSDTDFAAIERVEVDPYEDPVFSEPTKELPPVNEFPSVQIPRTAEPAPRFSTIPEQPSSSSPPVQTAVVTQPAPAQLTPTPAPAVVPARPAATAAVLPNVNWQAQPAQSVLRAPSEWTAWFLMGGAALIILLLFAPSRRTE